MLEQTSLNTAPVVSGLDRHLLHSQQAQQQQQQQQVTPDISPRPSMAFAPPSSPTMTTTNARPVMMTTTTAGAMEEERIIPIPNFDMLNSINNIDKRGRFYVDNIRVTDVLCGRGGRSNHHPGNKRYRQVIGEMKAMYQKMEAKSMKTDLSRAIVEHCCRYGARFVKKETNTGRYYILTKAEARKVQFGSVIFVTLKRGQGTSCFPTEYSLLLTFIYLQHHRKHLRHFEKRKT
jgi:hypothetical protein